MSALYNNLSLTEGAYVLMQDEDRFNNAEYDTHFEAIKAMEEYDEEGMWVGFVEKINDQLEIMFVYGDQA